MLNLSRSQRKWKGGTKAVMGAGVKKKKKGPGRIGELVRLSSQCTKVVGSIPSGSIKESIMNA